MTAACLLVRSPACSARQLQTSIVQVVHLCPTGFRKEPCERLERHKPKGLRVVLRGLGSSNAPRLPGGGGGDVTSLPDPQLAEKSPRNAEFKLCSAHLARITRCKFLQPLRYLCQFMYMTTVKLVLRNFFDLNYLRKMCGTWAETVRARRHAWPSRRLAWRIALVPGRGRAGLDVSC